MPENDVNKAWKEVLDIIKISVSSATFSTWFAPTFIVSVKKTNNARQTTEIGCPSPFVADGLEKRYFGLIQDALAQITGMPNDLTFTVKQRMVNKVPKDDNPLFSIDYNSESSDFVEVLKKNRIRPGFTFDNFAVSGTNQLAHAAAEAVSRQLGTAYNPLFLWGGVGVGKTHLMLAVAHKVLQVRPNLPALYCMGDEFTTEIVHAIRTKTTNEFKKRYRKLKLLLIDDVQFIAGKDAVQEEFFHTFNSLQREGGQIIMTSDKPPSEIQKLEKRLESRFEAGLIVDISPPDFELRAAITIIKAKERGIEITSEDAQFIAGNLDGPRKIEGFITKLSTLVNFSGQKVTREIIEKELRQVNGDVNDFRKLASPQAVIIAVSDYFSLGKRRLLGESRMRNVAHPRQILMYILRKDLGLSLKEVGRIVGGRDHTTVMHAVEKISKNLSTNPQLSEDIMGIKKFIFA